MSQSPAAHWAAVPFLDPDTAQFTVAGITKILPPVLAGVVPSLLLEVPDPDSALVQFSRFLQEASAETIRLVETNPALAHYALTVFGHSKYLGETLLQNLDLLQSFLKPGFFDRSLSHDEFREQFARFRSLGSESDISLLLARFKRREYVRILLRDVLQISPLAETTAEISALSDALIEEALREAEAYLQRSLGAPQYLDSHGRTAKTPFTVLSLGKLGGAELNYSSDVDLMFLYGDGNDLLDAPVSQREFFVRLAQKTIDILSRATQHGPVFRIDLRLRPQGNEGELAVSFGHALRYYSESAADWELQALIKVRHSAGDISLAREFIRAVRPFVYTENLNFAAIKTALVARERIQKARKLRTHLSADSRQLTGIDVKLDPGGIRDIEFLVQCLQRVYGGGEPWVRAGGTLFSLQKLHDNGHITGKDFHALSSAYEYLRQVEHRLQLRQGQQTHQLPSDPIEQQILQRAVSRSANAESLADAVRSKMVATEEIYQRIIYQQQARGAEPPRSDFELRSALGSSGDASIRQILQRLANDSPLFYQTATRSDLSSIARRNLFLFLNAAFATSERYSILLQNSTALERALRLFDSSDYLSHILIRHPEEMATLAELSDIPARLGSGYLFESSLGHVYTADPVFEFLGSGRASFAESQALLRRQFRHRVLVAGAKDILFHRPVAESLAETTAAAEDAIRAAFGIVGAPANLAILALGRLGSGEFDLLSDADLVFLCDRDSVEAQRTVERIVQLLNAYTQEGVVFPVDTRLRPHGRAGELLVTPSRLQLYFQEQARAWEVLSFTKMRFIAGSRTLADQAVSITAPLFRKFAAEVGFRHAVLEMRSRLESADRSIKTSAGGLYDIDFLCSYLLVRSDLPDQGGTLRDRLWRCVNAGLLNKADAAKLDHAAELFLSVDHAIRVLLGREQKWLPTVDRARQATEEVATQMLGAAFEHGLEQELIKNLQTVREIYTRELGTPA